MHCVATSASLSTWVVGCCTSSPGSTNLKKAWSLKFDTAPSEAHRSAVVLASNIDTAWMDHTAHDTAHRQHSCTALRHSTDTAQSQHGPSMVTVTTDQRGTSSGANAVLINISNHTRTAASQLWRGKKCGFGGVVIPAATESTEFNQYTDTSIYISDIR